MNVCPYYTIPSGLPVHVKRFVSTALLHTKLFPLPALHIGTQCPSLLRDLLTTQELEDIFGPTAVCTLLMIMSRYISTFTACEVSSESRFHIYIYVHIMVKTFGKSQGSAGI